MVYSSIMKMERLRHGQSFGSTPKEYAEAADEFVKFLSRQYREEISPSQIAQLRRNGLKVQDRITTDIFSYNKKLRTMAKPLAVFSGVAFGFAMTEGNAEIALLGIGLAGLSLVYAYTPKSQSFTRESIENQVGPHWR